MPVVHQRPGWHDHRKPTADHRRWSRDDEYFAVGATSVFRVDRVQSPAKVSESQHPITELANTAMWPVRLLQEKLLLS